MGVVTMLQIPQYSHFEHPETLKKCRLALTLQPNSNPPGPIERHQTLTPVLLRPESHSRHPQTCL